MFPSSIRHSMFSSQYARLSLFNVSSISRLTNNGYSMLISCFFLGAEGVLSDGVWRCFWYDDRAVAACRWCQCWWSCSFWTGWRLRQRRRQRFPDLFKFFLIRNRLATASNSPPSYKSVFYRLDSDSPDLVCNRVSLAVCIVLTSHHSISFWSWYFRVFFFVGNVDHYFRTDTF